jgi:tetratricopeptide (TPR) repeat protein
VQVYARRKQPARAMQAIEAEIAHSPHNAFARELHGALLLAEGQTEPAIAAYREAVSEAPTWAGAYHALAIGQLQGKHVDDAVATLRQGIAKASESAPLVTDLAALYQRLGRTDDAIALYNGVLTQNPSSVFAANNLALLLVKYKTDKASLARAQRLADQLTSSSTADVIDTRGWVKFKSGDYHGAESLLQQAVDKSPNLPELRYHLGMAQLRSGEPQSAQQNLEAALRTARPFDGINEARTTLAQLKKSPTG